MTYRVLRKFEYTDNSKAYLDSIEKVSFLMNKDFINNIHIYYGKIRVERVKAGLDSIGYHYLIRRLERGDYPPFMSKWEKSVTTLFIKAKFHDLSLSLDGSAQYALVLKGCSDQHLKEHYRVVTDQVFKNLIKHMRLLTLKSKVKMLQLTRQHCHKILSNKDCLWFKDDIIRAVGDGDFRISYNRLNRYFSAFLTKI